MDPDSIKKILVEENQPRQTYTPLSSEFLGIKLNKSHNQKQTVYIGIIALLLVVLGGIAYQIVSLTLSQKQTTQTEAALPACHTGTIPLPADPNCYTCRSGPKRGERAIAQKVDRLECEPGSFKVESAGHEFACSWCPEDAPKVLSGRGDENWTNCPAPMDGFCKSKGADCTECRDSNSGVRIICQCQQLTPTLTPTPTQFPSPTITPPLTITTTPTVTPRPTITSIPTPTIRPSVTPRSPTATPTPTSCPTPPRVINIRVTCPTCQ